MDRISSLPDEVLCHILSFLPTKHAVATSILSSRWLHLWLSVPVIDLDDSLYLNPINKDPNSALFVNFFDRVSSLNESETIVKFRLHMHVSLNQSNYLAEINGLIQNVFLRNVVEIDIEIYSTFHEDDDFNNLEIPHSESLKAVKVRTRYCLKMPAFPGCFPSLRVFDARFSLDVEDELMANLFPCLPALEKLYLVEESGTCDDEFKYNIGGPVLKHLELSFCRCDYVVFDVTVVIDAPKLEYLRLQDVYLASYVVKNKPAISEVRLDLGIYDYFLEILDEVGHTRLTRYNELLLGLVNAKFISVSAATLMIIYSEDLNLPVLPYLTKLELDVPAGSWMLLLQWLERCPNLKVLSLIMKEEPVEDFEEVVPDVVPLCLTSCVKEIVIKRLGKADEEEMLNYLLDNAKVLDKFTVDSPVLRCNLTSMALKEFHVISFELIVPFGH